MAVLFLDLGLPQRAFSPGIAVRHGAGNQRQLSKSQDSHRI